MNNFSIKQIQDMVIEREEWGEKKTIYATDSDKCPCGVYHSLIGTEPTTQIDPESLRRMETGKLVEDVQVRKLKSLGIYIEPEIGFQHRIFNEKYNVSGRLDALIISPDQCSKEAKKAISRKKEIYESLSKYRSNAYLGSEKYHAGEIDKDTLLKGRIRLLNQEQELYDENRELNKILLAPNPENQLMIVEIKSSNEWGFKYYMNSNRANDSHVNQITFYLSELRKKYPNILARILYVSVPFQEMLEFDVPYSPSIYENLQVFWKQISSAVKKKIPPKPAEDVIFDGSKWKVNYQAEWCRYHDKCTGDPNWFKKAKDKVLSMNLKSDKGIKKEKVEVKNKIIKKNVSKHTKSKSI